jgi:hypothetical protein
MSCNDNCPEKTSDITLFDGNFININVPEGSSLNDVLALLEQHFINEINNIETSYTLEADSACLGMTAGTYSLQEMVSAIIVKVCENASSIQDIYDQLGGISITVNTTDVTLDGIVLPSCAATFVGTTSTELFNYILTKLCETEVGIVFNPNTDDANSTNDLMAVNYRATREMNKGILDNDFVFNETTPTTSPTSFTTAIEPISAIIDGYYVNRANQLPLTLNSNSDIWVSLNTTGVFNISTQTIGNPQPALPGHMLYKFTTDGVGVVSLLQLYNTAPFNAVPLGVGDVETSNLQDGAVTSIKIDPVTTGATKGHPSVIEITYNDQGQVTSVTSNIDLTGISDGQIIGYNLALNRFEPVDKVAVTTVGNIPKTNGAGDNYTNSALDETANQIKSTKKIEVNSGASEDIATALLNLVGVGAMMFPRLTAVQAGTLPLLDGFMIYVTSTDATFTSVGFWGVENGGWIKL